MKTGFRKASRCGFRSVRAGGWTAEPLVGSLMTVEQIEHQVVLGFAGFARRTTVVADGEERRCPFRSAVGRQAAQPRLGYEIEESRGGNEVSSRKQHTVVEYAEIQLQRLDVAGESGATNLTGVAVDFHIVSTGGPPRMHPLEETGEEFGALVHGEPMLLPLKSLCQVTDVRPGPRGQVERVQRLVRRQGSLDVPGQRLRPCRDV